MNKQLIEQLSAFVDGELSEAAADHLLDRLQHDPQLQQLWQKFHLMRDALRSEGAQHQLEKIMSKALEPCD